MLEHPMRSEVVTVDACEYHRIIWLLPHLMLRCSVRVSVLCDRAQPTKRLVQRAAGACGALAGVLQSWFVRYGPPLILSLYVQI